MNKVVFVILPYKDADPMIVEQRVRAAELYCAELMAGGNFPICTTSWGHYLVKHVQVPDSQEFWEAHCHAMIDSAEEVHALLLPNWRDSVGLKDELVYIEVMGKPLTIFSEENVAKLWKRAGDQLLAEDDLEL